VCVCVCVCVRARACVCVSVCVHVRTLGWQRIVGLTNIQMSFCTILVGGRSPLEKAQILFVSFLEIRFFFASVK